MDAVRVAENLRAVGSGINARLGAQGEGRGVVGCHEQWVRRPRGFGPGMSS